MTRLSRAKIEELEDELNLRHIAYKKADLKDKKDKRIDYDILYSYIKNSLGYNIITPKVNNRLYIVK